MTVPFSTSPEQRHRIPELIQAARDAGFPSQFAEDVRALASEDQGMFELLDLWQRASPEDRILIQGDMVQILYFGG